MSRKKKIVIPTEDEVAQYAGDENNPADAGAQGPADGASESADPSQAGADGAAGDEPATPRSEAEEFKDKYLRARAELTNYQRRSEKDKAEALKFANSRLVGALLPVIDDLERVIEGATGGGFEAVLDGVKLTRDNFLKVLRDFHIEPIESVGMRFNPAEHEAMMQQPSDEHDEPTVLQELLKGYRLHDRVIRPARVIVSKPAGPPSEATDDDEGTDA